MSKRARLFKKRMRSIRAMWKKDPAYGSLLIDELTYEKLERQWHFNGSKKKAKDRLKEAINHILETNPPPGLFYTGLDFAAIEARITKRPPEPMAEGEDIHAYTARQILGSEKPRVPSWRDPEFHKRLMNYGRRLNPGEPTIRIKVDATYDPSSYAGEGIPIEIDTGRNPALKAEPERQELPPKDEAARRLRQAIKQLYLYWGYSR